MNTETAVNALCSLISLAVILHLWLRAYPSMRVEEFRQDVFRLRNSMFDAAAKGDIDFDDAMYSIVRNVMNGMLNDADNITFFNFIAKRLLIEKYGQSKQFEEMVKPSLNALPKPKRDIYDQYMTRLGMALFTLIAKRGFVVYSAFRLTYVIGKLRASAMNLLLPAARLTEYEAYQIGRSLPQ